MQEMMIRHIGDLARAATAESGPGRRALPVEEVRYAFQADFGYQSVESVAAEVGGQDRLRRWAKQKRASGQFRTRPMQHDTPTEPRTGPPE